MIRILSVIICINFLFFSSCNRNGTSIIDSAKDSAVVADKVSIRQLAKNISNMNGKIVEVKGILSLNFEDVALYDYGLFSDNKASLWLDFSDKLASSKDLDRLKDQKVTVKGRVNANRNGHFGYYLATLEDVYYIVQE